MSSSETTLLELAAELKRLLAKRDRNNQRNAELTEQIEAIRAKMHQATAG